MGPRSEVGWSGTGGGTSAYTPTPSYQTAAVPGLGSVGHRTVADVAFNADPSTGQYVATIAPGSSAVSWLSVGGTSLSTPQWAGLIAIANAQRVAAGKPLLGAPHSILYGQAASSATTYSTVFADVTRGSDGTCATCSARQGYDPLSGLGTPNTSSLLTVLSGASSTATTPAPTPTPTPTPAPTTGTTATGLTITSTSFSGTAGVALSGTIVIADPGATAVTVQLAGIPSGMVFSASNLKLTASWAKPVKGTYSIVVQARDSAGKSAQLTIPVSIK